MAVRIRLKKFGRKHRPFYRLCAMDVRSPRNGRVLEELGYYDPLVPGSDACAVLNGERINYWLSVGALPTPKAGILIKKYGANGTCLAAQAAALENVAKARAPRTASAPKGYVTPAAPEAPAEPAAVTEPAAE